MELFTFNESLKHITVTSQSPSCMQMLSPTGIRGNNNLRNVSSSMEKMNSVITYIVLLSPIIFYNSLTRETSLLKYDSHPRSNPLTVIPEAFPEHCVSSHWPSLLSYSQAGVFLFPTRKQSSLTGFLDRSLTSSQPPLSSLISTVAFASHLHFFLTYLLYFPSRISGLRFNIWYAKFNLTTISLIHQIWNFFLSFSSSERVLIPYPKSD